MSSPAHAFDYDNEPVAPTVKEAPATDEVAVSNFQAAVTDTIFRFVTLGFVSLFGILGLAAYLTF